VGKFINLNAFKNALIVASMLFTVADVAAEKLQTVTGSLSVAELSAGQSTELTVSYTATDDDVAQLTQGIGLRLHFDSSMVSLGDPSTSNTYKERLFTGSQPFQIKDDTDDADSDPKTDKYWLTSWANSGSGAGWPADGNTGEALEQPLNLYIVPINAISGYNGSTLNFTTSSVSAGYTFAGDSVTLGKIPGTVSTLSDLTASYPAFVAAASGINIPVEKTGDGPDKTNGTADDVTVKGSYVAGDLTFVRPPVNTEAPAATWCPNSGGCTTSNNTAKDAVRMGNKLGFRRMQFAEAEAWCTAENGR